MVINFSDISEDQNPTNYPTSNAQLKIPNNYISMYPKTVVTTLVIYTPTIMEAWII
jgi:hypothetical protein